VAAIEYNYEKDGQIVVPAGTKALGTLQQADRSGYVAIHLPCTSLPDGATRKSIGGAMSLTYGPLKGNVSGERREPFSRANLHGYWDTGDIFGGAGANKRFQ